MISLLIIVPAQAAAALRTSRSELPYKKYQENTKLFFTNLYIFYINYIFSAIRLAWQPLCFVTIARQCSVHLETQNPISCTLNASNI